jgi:hypothetical protein
MGSTGRITSAYPGVVEAILFVLAQLRNVAIRSLVIERARTDFLREGRPSDWQNFVAYASSERDYPAFNWRYFTHKFVSAKLTYRRIRRIPSRAV